MFYKVVFSSILFLGIFKNEFQTNLLSRLEENVYICNGGSSKVYHKLPNCRGLSNCSTEIEKVSISIAIGKGRRSCRIEY